MAGVRPKCLLQSMLRITKQTDYGILLLAQFVEIPAGEVLSAKDLALRTGVPQPTVAKTLKLLAQRDILVSHRGAGGGFELGRPAAELPLVDVIAALEGPIAMTECAEALDGVCSFEASCRVRVNWRRINQVVFEALAGITLAEMVEPGPLPVHASSGGPAEDGNRE